MHILVTGKKTEKDKEINVSYLITLAHEFASDGKSSLKIVVKKHDSDLFSNILDVHCD